MSEAFVNLASVCGNERGTLEYSLYHRREIQFSSRIHGILKVPRVYLRRRLFAVYAGWGVYLYAGTCVGVFHGAIFPRYTVKVRPHRGRASDVPFCRSSDWYEARIIYQTGTDVDPRPKLSKFADAGGDLPPGTGTASYPRHSFADILYRTHGIPGVLWDRPKRTDISLATGMAPLHADSLPPACIFFLLISLLLILPVRH